MGMLDGNKINEEFTSDASPDYKSYITNPLDTIQQTSRLLRKRSVCLSSEALLILTYPENEAMFLYSI